MSSLPKDVSGGRRFHGLRRHLDKNLEEGLTESYSVNEPHLTPVTVFCAGQLNGKFKWEQGCILNALIHNGRN